MAEEKPTSPEEFAAWSTEATCGLFRSSTETWFKTSQNNLFAEMQDLSFFSSISDELQKIGEKYRLANESDLFAHGRIPKPDWNKKSYTSFLEKLYRLNCVENPHFPNPPDDGWISLDTSFEKIDDIVRTTLVVAYADAPEFLGLELANIATAKGHHCDVKDHAKEKGYYAFHLYPRVRVNIAATLGSGTYPEREVPVEIQIVTELQGALREITHKLYEKERLAGGLDQNWKKNFRSGRFRAAYMAHSLRFIEAMIVDLRQQMRDN